MRVVPTTRTSRIVKRFVAFALALFATASLVGYGCLTCTPGWYDPPEIPPAQRQSVRNNLVEAEQAFTEALRAQAGAFVYHLHAEDLNRWLAMRREIYPGLESVLPAGVTDPFVTFDDGVITIAARHVGRGPNAIISLDIAPQVEGDAIALHAQGARCGVLPVPLGWEGLFDSVELDLDRGVAWPGSPRIRGSLKAGLRLEAEAWWKNGGIAYRVLEVTVAPGELRLRVEPLGRRQEAGESRQEEPPSEVQHSR